MVFNICFKLRNFSFCEDRSIFGLNPYKLHGEVKNVKKVNEMYVTVFASDR